MANVSLWPQMPDCPQIGSAQMFVLPGYDAFLGFLLIGMTMFQMRRLSRMSFTTAAD